MQNPSQVSPMAPGQATGFGWGGNERCGGGISALPEAAEGGVGEVWGFGRL